MQNKSSYNKLFNLSHKSNYYLTNNYEDEVIKNKWDNDEIINTEDEIPINDDYYNEYMKNNKYSFLERNKFK